MLSASFERYALDSINYRSQFACLSKIFTCSFMIRTCCVAQQCWDLNFNNTLSPKLAVILDVHMCNNIAVYATMDLFLFIFCKAFIKCLRLCFMMIIMHY